MYMHDKDRPVCPVCGKKLGLFKLDGDDFMDYFWYCECLMDITINNVEPDVIICMNKEIN